jgi:hypothetical protein
VADGFAWIFQLFTPFIAVSGAGALGSGAGTSIIVLLIVIPDDLIV